MFDKVTDEKTLTAISDYDSMLREAKRAWDKRDELPTTDDKYRGWMYYERTERELIGPTQELLKITFAHQPELINAALEQAASQTFDPQSQYDGTSMAFRSGALKQALSGFIVSNAQAHDGEIDPETLLEKLQLELPKLAETLVQSRRFLEPEEAVHETLGVLKQAHMEALAFLKTYPRAYIEVVNQPGFLARETERRGLLDAASALESTDSISEATYKSILRTHYNAYLAASAAVARPDVGSDPDELAKDLGAASQAYEQLKEKYLVEERLTQAQIDGVETAMAELAKKGKPSTTAIAASVA